MSFNIGINIVEVDGRAAPSIQAAPTSVTGFTITAQRGIPGEVVRVTNWSQFLEHFGAYRADAYGAYAIRGFFDNGGTTAYITRVVNTTPGTANAASIVSDEGPWRLTPGGRLIFNTNLSATLLEVTFNASAATLEGGTGPFSLDDGSGSGTPISLTVNGVSHGPYQFDPEDFTDLEAATAAEIAAVLNREFPGIQAWVDPGDNRLRVRTDRRGTSASLEAGEAAAAELGLSAAGQVNGVGDVTDIDAVTSAEAVDLIGAVLRPLDFTVTEEDGRIRIEHPSTGSDQTLQVDSSSDAALGFDNEVHAGSDGDAAAAAVAASHTFDGVLTVTAAYRGQEDVGEWGNTLRVKIKTNGEDEALFDLTVTYNNAEVEAWEALSIDENTNNFVEKKLNDEFSGSKFIRVEASGTTNPQDTPATALTGGRNGHFASSADEVNAFEASIDLFDNVDIQLLTCPEIHERALVSKALTHCEEKGDRMFLGHTPENFDAGEAKGYGKDFQDTKVYGTLYFPWIRVADPLSTRKWIPPTGHIAGVYARTDRERGVWKAPAGDAARIRGALDIRYSITDVDHTDLVKNGSVNAVRFIPGRGIVVDSSRTLSTSPLWLYVNVRLLFNFVKSSLKDGLRWTVQEPNDDTLWNKAKYNSVTPFLMGLWRRGAFGPGAPDEVFTVKVDAENNPPANIQQGILNIEVYFYPSRPAETIIITVGQQEGGATAGES
jgi:phage tail sheath protein FI